LDRTENEDEGCINYAIPLAECLSWNSDNF